jgi:hypothetical protein
VSGDRPESLKLVDVDANPPVFVAVFVLFMELK